MNHLFEPIEFRDVHPLSESNDLDLMLPRKGIILKSFFASLMNISGNREAIAQFQVNRLGLCQEILSEGIGIVEMKKPMKNRVI